MQNKQPKQTLIFVNKKNVNKIKKEFETKRGGKKGDLILDFARGNWGGRGWLGKEKMKRRNSLKKSREQGVPVAAGPWNCSRLVSHLAATWSEEARTQTERHRFVGYALGRANWTAEPSTVVRGAQSLFATRSAIGQHLPHWNKHPTWRAARPLFVAAATDALAEQPRNFTPAPSTSFQIVFFFNE